MPKLSRKRLDSKILGGYVNNLWSAFTLMETKQDIKLLFKDLFTHTEYKMFAKRLEIARRLLNNENYEAITKALGVTSGTISKVNNTLSERGEGLRKADKKLLLMENRAFQKQKEYQKHLENPFNSKAKRKTIIGTLLKGGAKALDTKISLALKGRTAKQTLEV
jgi:uncharacterized protein YerC